MRLTEWLIARSKAKIEKKNSPTRDERLNGVQDALARLSNLTTKNEQPLGYEAHTSSLTDSIRRMRDHNLALQEKLDEIQKHATTAKAEQEARLRAIMRKRGLNTSEQETVLTLMNSRKRLPDTASLSPGELVIKKSDILKTFKGDHA